MITFKVQVKSREVVKDGEQPTIIPQYLDVNGRPSDEGFEFQIRDETGLDTIKIQRKCHELSTEVLGTDDAGEAYAELDVARDKYSAWIAAKLEARLWPDGRPKAEGLEYLEQQKRYNEAYNSIEQDAVDKPLDADRQLLAKRKKAYIEIDYQLSMIETFARWYVLSDKMPADWRRVDLHPCWPIYGSSIIAAYRIARHKASLGLTQPSSH